MSMTFTILPMVWATEDFLAPTELSPAHASPAIDRKRQQRQEMAIYRRYTEAILRRYLKMSMEAGRAPSLLGREMFRGRVTAYQVHSFEDVVIFVHDVEKCLAELDDEQRYFIDRFALQEYTHDEGTLLTGMTRRTMVRRYEDALDRLSRVLLAKGLLEVQKCSPAVQKCCQAPQNTISLVTV